MGLTLRCRITLVWAPNNSWETYATEFYVVANGNFDILLHNGYVTELDAIDKNKSWDFQRMGMGLRLRLGAEQPADTSSDEQAARQFEEQALAERRRRDERARREARLRKASVPDVKDSYMGEANRSDATGSKAPDRVIDQALPLARGSDGEVSGRAGSLSNEGASSSSAGASRDGNSEAQQRSADATFLPTYSRYPSVNGDDNASPHRLNDQNEANREQGE